MDAQIAAAAGVCKRRQSAGGTSDAYATTAYTPEAVSRICCCLEYLLLRCRIATA